MSARTQVAALLAAQLPDSWNVIKRAKLPDTLPKPTLFLWGEKLARLNHGGIDWVQSSVVLWCLPPSSAVDADPELLEDKLDQQLATLLAAVEACRELTWSEAERLDLEGVWPGYKLTLQVPLKLDQ